MKKTLLVILAAISAATVIGCGGSDSGDDAATPTAAATQVPASTPTPDPELDTRPTVTAGEVSSKVFAPGVTLTLPASFRLDDRDFVFSAENNTEDPASGVWIAFFHPTEVRDPKLYAPVPAPDDIIAWLQQHPRVTFLDGPSSMTVAGLQATVAEIGVDAQEKVPMFEDFEAEPRDHFRVIQLSAGGQRLIIVAGATHWQNFEAAKPQIDALLNSVKIQG